jgi:hypothetical protein
MERNRKVRLLILVGFKCKTFKVSTSAEPFQLSCLLMLISITYAGLDIHGVLLFRTLIGKVR